MRPRRIELKLAIKAIAVAIRFAFFVVTVVAIMTVSARALDRWVLAIGNGDYLNLTDLEKSVNDAEFYKNLFESAGYRAVDDRAHKHLDQINLRGKINEVFELAGAGGGEVVITYSGHGVTMLDNNRQMRTYLLPTDVAFNPSLTASFIRGSLISVQEIVEKAETARISRLVIIVDACRTDPIFDASSDFGYGSSSISLPGNRDYAVIFSSAGDQVAYERLSILADDGPDPNELSVFTRSFKRNIEATSSLVDAFLQTQIDVMKATEGQQRHGVQRPVIFATMTREFEVKPVIAYEHQTAPAPDTPRWAVRPKDCRIDSALLRTAIVARDRGRLEEDLIWANRICLSEAALKSLGVERLREIDDKHPVIVAATEGSSAFQTGDALDRVSVQSRSDPRDKSRPIRIRSIDDLETYLGANAFKSDLNWFFFIRRDENTRFLTNIQIQ